MPSAIIHRCVNKKVQQVLNKYQDVNDIYINEVASIAPDSWRNTIQFKNSELKKIEKRKFSHFSNGLNYIENYKQFKQKYISIIDNPFIFGYLVHLMTDNFWREEMSKDELNKTGEEKSSLSKDVEILTKQIKDYYKINELNELTEEQISNIPTINEMTYDGINATIRFTNHQLIKETSDEPEEYNLEEIINGIEKVSQRIIDELKEV